ncbi:HAMP domain-containing histidine kinase [Patescibacteria group bacterium]|nr:HAMP domain-containing histidine kinase [Patescibacteria group bacterium]
MNLKKILDQLDIPAQCRRHKIPLWQCPQFLFLIMGLVIIGSAITAYLIGTRYIEDPEIIALIVLVLSSVLFIFTYIINISFERLAEVSRLKSEFIRIVSHQLRSPLTNVSWAIDILLSGALGGLMKEQVEYFRILKENNARMRELVKDLLLVSRLEEGALPIRRERISLKNIIKNLVSKFLPFARASNVKIKFESEKDLPEIFVDPHQVEIVVETLLDNAIRYIEKGGLIEICLGKKEENIFFKIKDTGVGIPQEDQKYIFQKFFRSKTTQRGVAGSGLGLFISKSIIDRMGGKIWFESEEGRGTTFYFTLPIK